MPHFVLLWKGVSRIPLDVSWNTGLTEYGTVRRNHCRSDPVQIQSLNSPTPVADKNLVALKLTNTPTRPRKAKMVTPTYTTGDDEVAPEAGTPRLERSVSRRSQTALPLCFAITLKSLFARGGRTATNRSGGDREETCHPARLPGLPSVRRRR